MFEPALQTTIAHHLLHFIACPLRSIHNNWLLATVLLPAAAPALTCSASALLTACLLLHIAAGTSGGVALRCMCTTMSCSIFSRL
jgi:hypothetical protein